MPKYLCISDLIQKIYWINFAKAVDCNTVNPPWSRPVYWNQRLWYQMIPSSPSPCTLFKTIFRPISLPPGEVLTSSEGELQRTEWWEWRFSLPFPPQLPPAPSSPNGGQKGDWRYWEEYNETHVYKHMCLSIAETVGRNMQPENCLIKHLWKSFMACVWLLINKRSWGRKMWILQCVKELWKKKQRKNTLRRPVCLSNSVYSWQKKTWQAGGRQESEK